MSIKFELHEHYCRADQIQLAMHWANIRGSEHIYYPETRDLHLIDSNVVEINIEAEDLHLTEEEFATVEIIEYEEEL